MLRNLKKTFVIAEVGNNHEGNFNLAKRMILQAKKSGADAVKFQTIIPELLNVISDKKRIKQLKKYQFSFEQFKKLSDYSKKNKIIFISTPTDLSSAGFLNKIQKYFKIASGDNDFYPLIKKIASFNKPILLSTGLSDYKDIQNAKRLIFNEWKKKGLKKNTLTLMHCVSSYPVEKKYANLTAIKSLKNKFKDCTIGYSDHTIGILACTIAVAYGARVIEKHFTLNKNQSNFRDHKLSADPSEMRQLVENIRLQELMRGNGIKKLEVCEKNYIKSLRRSAVASRNLKKNKTIIEQDIKWVRSQSGIKIKDKKAVLGKKLKKNIVKDQIIFSKFLKK